MRIPFGFVDEKERTPVVFSSFLVWFVVHRQRTRDTGRKREEGGGGLGRRGRESEDPSGPDTTKCTEIYSAGN